MTIPHSKRNENGINISSGLDSKRYSGNLPRIMEGAHLDTAPDIAGRKKSITGSTYIAGIYSKPKTDAPKIIPRALFYGIVAATCFAGGIARRYAVKNGVEPAELMPGVSISFIYPLILGGAASISGKYEKDRGTTDYFEAGCGVVAGGLVGVISEAAGEFVGSFIF